MQKLGTNDYNKVVPLIKDIDHNRAIVYAIVEKNSPGEIYVENAIEPKSAFIDTKDGFYYLVGIEDNNDFNTSIYDLIFTQILPRREEKELILFSYSNSWREKLDDLLKDRGAIRIHRKTFTFVPEKFQSFSAWKTMVPSGYKVVPIDSEVASINSKYETIVNSPKKFGFCVMREDEIISECLSVYVGDNEVEIGIETNEKYRHQGFGTIVASAFIEHCLLNRLTPNWACWPYREESIKLAQKLGFEDKADVPAHFWAENM